MKRKEIIPLGVAMDLHKRPDAHLLLTKPYGNWDVAIIKFPSRLSLEKFNEKANLHAVIKTQVPMNCVLYRHQSDSDARKKRLEYDQVKKLVFAEATITAASWVRYV